MLDFSNHAARCIFSLFSFLHQILCLVDLKFLNAGSSSWRLLPLIALIPFDHQKGYGLEETG
jgi:hypothetical protein